MKKAVITSGSKQYLVTEGEVVDVELIATDGKTVTFEPLLIFDEKTVQVGTPLIKGASVKAEVVETDIQGDKVTAIRYKAKKRVKKVHGHRQHHTRVKITAIS